MRKFFILAGVIFFITSIVTGQTSVAKLKFEEAEEAYSNNDFPSAIKKLSEAEKMYGKINPPILHLRVISQNKLYASQDNASLEDIYDLRAQCMYYLKNYENLEGMEEKYKDVYKVYDAYQDFEFLDNLVPDARSGNAQAMLMLANNYSTIWEYAKAKEWNQRAIDKGYLEAYGSQANVLSNMQEKDEMNDKIKELLLKGIKENSPRSMFIMGERYLFDNNSKDTVVAAEWFAKCKAAALKSAENGDPWSMYVLGLCYQRTYAKMVDLPEAMRWYKKAVDAGHVQSMTILGNGYTYGIGLEKDGANGLALYESALSKGYLPAMSSISSFYKSKDFKKDDKSFEWDLKNARVGNPINMYQVGDSYLYGNRVKVDYAQAKYWFNRSANKGLGYPMYQMGKIFQNGWGVEINLVAAFNWYSKAAAKQYSPSYIELGALCYQGKGTKQDYYEAIKWFTKSAETKNVAAMDWLGDCYNYGLKDYGKAVEWYTKAIEGGNQYSLNSLGTLYYKGEGLKKDYEKAFNYFNQSANKGYWLAMENLAICYEEGNGVKKNKTLAKEWQDKATAAKGK